MNTRGEVLFGLTCTFDCYRLGRHDGPTLWASDLPAWIAVYSSSECDVDLLDVRCDDMPDGPPNPLRLITITCQPPAYIRHCDVMRCGTAGFGIKFEPDHISCDGWPARSGLRDAPTVISPSQKSFVR